MKSKITRLTAGAFLLFLLICTSSNKGYSQFFGLSSYLVTDSVPGANHCINDAVDGAIYWYQAGTYLPGDEVDINVDWGDGNTSSYANTPILIGSGYGYINQINISHLYTVAGNYTVIISSLDGYGNADGDTFNLNVSNLCGSVFTTVYLDNGDAVYGSGDILMPSVDVILTSPGPSYFSNTFGYGYGLITNIDIYEPSYTLEIDPSWLSGTGMTVVQPVSGDYTVTGLGTTPQTFQFLLDCGSSTYYDANIYGFGWGFRAGQSTGYALLNISNVSCTGGPTSVDISLDFDPLLTVYSASLPGATITPGNISWNATSIPFGNSYVYVYFTVPPATPALTPLAFQADVNSISLTDVDLSNNTTIFNSEVRNSWDPNDKSTNVEHYIDVNTQEEIQYTVRFQNMGNDDAYNIHIVDTISSLLDLTTLKIVSQSHAGSYSINPTTREVIFTFPNINLVPQSADEELSQGYIMYTIEENAGLPLNSEINNTAHIFFDGNEAVVTNTTSNVNIANVGIDDESPLSSVTVYPVPANTFVFIDGIDPQDITGLKIIDLNGKVVQTINQNMTSSYISVSEIPNGFYMLEISSGLGSAIRKICIQH